MFSICGLQNDVCVCTGCVFSERWECVLPVTGEIKLFYAETITTNCDECIPLSSERYQEQAMNHTISLRQDSFCFLVHWVLKALIRTRDILSSQCKLVSLWPFVCQRNYTILQTNMSRLFEGLVETWEVYVVFVKIFQLVIQFLRYVVWASCRV